MVLVLLETDKGGSLRSFMERANKMTCAGDLELFRVCSLDRDRSLVLSRQDPLC